MFGRVIRGFEVVQRITEVPTDEKDRPRGYRQPWRTYASIPSPREETRTYVI